MCGWSCFYIDDVNDVPRSRAVLRPVNRVADDPALLDDGQPYGAPHGLPALARGLHRDAARVNDPEVGMGRVRGRETSGSQ